MADQKNPAGPPPVYADPNAPPSAYPPQYPQQYPQQQQYPPPQQQQYPPGPSHQNPPPPNTVGYYPGPAPGQPQQPGYVVVTQPTVTVVGGAFTVGESPMQVTCPSCRNTIVTTVSHEVGLLCWIIVGVLCIFGCWPCCLIPFCVSSCKDVVHTCPSCNTVVGRYKRM